jgi:hypothetical protein
MSPANSASSLFGCPELCISKPHPLREGVAQHMVTALVREDKHSRHGPVAHNSRVYVYHRVSVLVSSRRSTLRVGHHNNRYPTKLIVSSKHLRRGTCVEKESGGTKNSKQKHEFHSFLPLQVTSTLVA